MHAPKIFDRIGKKRIETIIRDFYQIAFDDPILAHFFFKIDREHLICQQIDFTSTLLGGPPVYKGRSLALAHENLNLRKPHLARRQRIMAETLKLHQIPPELSTAWLRKEEQVLASITRDKLNSDFLRGCNS